MDLVIPKQELLRLVARCKGVADKKSAMPALANMLLAADDSAPLLSVTHSLACLHVGAKSNKGPISPYVRVG